MSGATFAPWAPVKILRGPLAGAVGTVMHCDGGACLVNVDGIVNGGQVQVQTEYPAADLTQNLQAAHEPYTEPEPQA